MASSRIRRTTSAAQDGCLMLPALHLPEEYQQAINPVGGPEESGMAGHATQTVGVFVVHFTSEKALSPRTIFRSGEGSP